MKTLSYALVACAFGGLAATSGQAQFSFNSGSNGSYGPMAITTNTTLELPPDGKFHCTTINVASNATLRFTPNALNTPVYLLATGDVAINGMVDVSGKTGYYYAVGGAGGPGGFAGGRAAFSGLSQGDGYGPGGGKKFTFGGSGSYRSSIGDAYCGSVYGSPLLMPVVGGSGGGADMGVNCSGGGGGVGVLVAAATRITINGTIVAQGGGNFTGDSSRFNAGSGGGIRLVAPVVEGSGTLNVRGGLINSFIYKYAGSGRIRIDCMDRRALSLAILPDISAMSVGANMLSFLSPEPRIDITQVAGTNITVGASSPVFFYLPQGSSSNQTVTVQASDFGAVVPIRVVLTPDSGTNTVYDTQIDNTTVNPASVTVPVTVPVNVQVQVNAWTR
jgi:hypothetical protein